MSEDPVAEFLAREKAELGDIASEVRGSSDVESDAEPYQPSAHTDTKPVEKQEDVNGFTSSVLEPPADTFAEEIVDNKPSMTAEVIPEPLLSDAESSGRAKATTKEEPAISPLMESWRINFERDIKMRDEKEEKQRLELEANAKKELETWYAHYNENRALRSSENRSEAPRDASGKTFSGYSGPKPSVNDTAVWDSVCSMCDLQGKNLKCTRDLTRMRGLLLNMKSNPTTV